MNNADILFCLSLCAMPFVALTFYALGRLHGIKHGACE